MRAKREYRRNRSETEVAVLDALVDRNAEGMTVFELRSRVGADIDEIEDALSDLKQDGLITVERNDGRTVIKPDPKVIPDPGNPEPADSWIDRIREKLPFL